MKPYGKSFGIDRGRNSQNVKDRNSIWYYDSPNLFERAVQMLVGVCKFTQADCTTLAYGNVRVVCASLYPIERGFFRNKLGTGLLSDVAADFATSVGDGRVDYIQGNANYFEDLVREYDFYAQGHNQTVTTDGGEFKYIIAENFASIEAIGETNQDTVVLVLSIEGLHVLHNDIDNPNLATVLDNIRAIKQWRHVPFFVTFAHHFNNHFCGHAKSLFGIIGSKADQSDGLNGGFTDMGREVMHAILSNQNGKRIHIDIKHMSAPARREYIRMISDPAGQYAGQNIPIIISHGACNGLRSMDERIIDIKETGATFLTDDINIYDDEIIALSRSNGIIGIQLDERRIADKETIKRLKHSIWISKIRHYRAALLWAQVQHIAELLDKNDLFAWGNIAIGSDYDGIIDPLNGYLTQETVVHLEEYVERHAFNYLNGRGKTILRTYNQISADEVVQRLFHSNAMAFMRKHFV